MAGLTIPRIAAISAALSTPRMSRYVTTCGNDHARALDLYEWNAEVSAAFMVPMHICEVVLRNAIVGAIEEVYGSNWYARGTAFERSLPKPIVGYSPFRDLDISRQGRTSAGKVIPELKFMFLGFHGNTSPRQTPMDPAHREVLSSAPSDGRPA